MVETTRNSENWNPKGYKVRPVRPTYEVKYFGNKQIRSSDGQDNFCKWFVIPEGSTKDEMKEAYNEARVLLEHPHPNIIQVRDVVKEDLFWSEIITVFEWVDGQTLKEWMEKE